MPKEARWAQNVDDAWSSSVKRPDFSIADILLHFLRSWKLMLPIFLLISGIGIACAMFLISDEYAASSRLMVSVGDEYVYVPSVGVTNQAVAPEQEELVRAEIELLYSPTVAEMTLKKLGVETLYPKILSNCLKDMNEAAASPGKKLDNPYGDEDIAGVPALCFYVAAMELRESFWAGAEPKSRIVGTGFRHKNPALTATTLNTMIESYLSYRSNLFANSTDQTFEARRQQFEDELKAAEQQISVFLEENGIGDFESERATIRQLYQSTSSDLLNNQSRSRSVEGQLDVVQRQLLTLNPEQNLFVEDSSSQTLVELKLEREELLTRYTPTSRLVTDINERIAQTERFLNSQTGPTGLIRRGPNPIFTEIDTSAKSLEAEEQSLSQNQIEIRRQLTEIEGRQRRLTDLEPAYLELLRRRDLLSQNLTSIAGRAAEENTRRQLFEQNVDNIRVLEKAIPPLEASGSLKIPVALLSILFGAFTALIVGLLRSFSSEVFSTRKSVERTFGLPVLSAVNKQ